MLFIKIFILNADIGFEKNIYSNNKRFENFMDL